MAGSTAKPPVPGTEPPALTPASQFALRLTVVLIVAYAALDVLAQLLPPHYSPVTQAESDLAVGPFGFVMTVNFVVRGVLSLSFLAGLAWATGLAKRSRAGFALLGAWGVGAFLLAVFPTDIGPTETSVHGQIHLTVAFLAFLAAAVGEWLLAREFVHEPALDARSGVARGLAYFGLFAFVLLVLGVGSHFLEMHAFGLLERVFIGAVLLWMLVVSLVLLTSRSRARPVGAAPS